MGDMEDMVDTDTTTAKRLPKKPPTMSPLSPLLISLSPLPTPPMLKQSTLKIALPPKDQVILCRSIVPHKECFQDNIYPSIFIITIFMPYKNAFRFLLTG